MGFASALPILRTSGESLLCRRQRHPGQLAQPVEKSLLKVGIGRFVRRLLLPEVMPVTTADQAAGFMLTASQGLVRCPGATPTGAPAPPILVRTQPGSTALLSTCGQRRAKAKASATMCSLLSAYALAGSQVRLVQSKSPNDPSPPRWSPLLRYTSRSGRFIRAVSK